MECPLFHEEPKIQVPSFVKKMLKEECPTLGLHGGRRRFRKTQKRRFGGDNKRYVTTAIWVILVVCMGYFTAGDHASNEYIIKGIHKVLNGTCGSIIEQYGFFKNPVCVNWNYFTQLVASALKSDKQAIASLAVLVAAPVTTLTTINIAIDKLADAITAKIENPTSLKSLQDAPSLKTLQDAPSLKTLQDAPEKTLVEKGDPYKNLRVEELKNELRKRGMSCTGNKAVLLSRLKEA